jgi:hypothetical protein
MRAFPAREVTILTFFRKEALASTLTRMIELPIDNPFRIKEIA